MSNQSAANNAFAFKLIEDNGENVTDEILAEDDQRDLKAGMTEAETLKSGRYKMKRGGFSRAIRN